MGGRLSYPQVELKDKVAIVTGGNTGIGYETAKALAIMGAHTIIACRSEERGQQVSLLILQLHLLVLLPKLVLPSAIYDNINTVYVNIDSRGMHSIRPMKIDS